MNKLNINPDGLTNQIQGNVIQGAGRELKEEVTWDDHLVTSLDWSGYQILTFPEVLPIEVALIDRPEEDALGAGEPAICPVPAAIGNAIFDATGVRMRALPSTPDRVLEALGTAPSAEPPGLTRPGRARAGRRSAPGRHRGVRRG